MDRMQRWLLSLMVWTVIAGMYVSALEGNVGRFVLLTVIAGFNFGIVAYVLWLERRMLEDHETFRRLAARQAAAVEQLALRDAGAGVKIETASGGAFTAQQSLLPISGVTRCA